MQAFRNALDACDLLDLGFGGSSFTWCNGRFGEQRTLVRLEKMVANSNWKSLFPGARVPHRSTSTSDHCSLILHSFHAPKNRRKKPRFRFETMWLREEASLMTKECGRTLKKALKGPSWITIHPSSCLTAPHNLLSWNRSSNQK